AVTVCTGCCLTLCLPTGLVLDSDGVYGCCLPTGLVLDGGSDSVYGVLFIKEVLPGSVALLEGSLRPLDLVHYINGAPTLDLTLNESCRLLEISLRELTIKATRDGKPVSPGQKSISFLNNNVSPEVSTSLNDYVLGADHRETEAFSTLCPPEVTTPALFKSTTFLLLDRLTTLALHVTIATQLQALTHISIALTVL
ncbi:unnamed protein product, partial [Oncorhynchus mykiss]